MTIEKLRPKFAFTEERLKQLKQVVPEAFADGKINWDVLREALGEYLEDDSQEHFGLFWPGKRDARRLAAMPPQGTLVPAPGEGVNEDETHNLFIEGENLEVLKLLQKSYAGRVKMIYIDPPYNTGNDFIYPDDYSEPLEAYLRRTGQMDEEGRRLTTNTRASGRFHSNWLNMIYPRLLLARQLLREDGLIFVSIDDNEVHNLRQVMNEVFGEENFVTQFVWNSSTAGGLRAKHVNRNHEYVLFYARNIDTLPMLFAPLSPEAIKQYNKKDSKGRYREKDFAWVTNAYNPNQDYFISCPDGSSVRPAPGYQFRFVYETFQKALQEGMVVFKRTNTSPLIDQHGDQAKWNIYIKKYLDNGMGAPASMLPKSVVGISNAGTQELKELFDARVFDNPKSTRFLEYLLQIGVGPDDIVLDFFAGTCSTAHAVLQLGIAEKSNIRFLTVQIPEPLDPNKKEQRIAVSVCDQLGKPRTLAEIGKERIRRVIAKLQSEGAQQAETPAGQLPLVKQNEPSPAAGQPSTVDSQPSTVDSQPSPVDLGFKVLRLDRSHFKRWQPVEPTEPARLDDLFSQAASPLVDGWSKEGLLTEILLIEGFPLDSRIIRLEEGFPDNDVRRVHHADVGHELFICLDETVQPSTVDRLPSLLRSDDIFICLDAALTDQDKVVLDDRVRLKVI